MRHVLLNLELEEDYSRIWVRQTWYVSGRVFLDGPLIFGVPRSRRLFHFGYLYLFLLVHYIQCKQALCSITGAIKKPLRVDHVIAVVIRPSVARVLIEFDVSKPSIPRIWIGTYKSGFWQEVIFEQFPAYCTTCKHFGHLDGECFIANPALWKTQQPNHEIQTTTDSDPTPIKERENPSAISPLSVETRGPQNDVAVRDPTILYGNAAR